MKWSRAKLFRLVDLYAAYSAAKTSRLLKLSESCVRSALKRYGIRKDARQSWTSASIARLKERYPHRPAIEISAELGFTIGAVSGKASELGLKKSEAFLDSDESGRLLRKGHAAIGHASRFRKGQEPPNKGLRRPGWYTGRMRETQFKKGCRSGAAARKWRPVGTILPDSSGYLRIKVREAVPGKEPFGFGNVKVWPLLNRIVWEQHRGPIPPGYIVAFKDKDRANCAIGNLELISRKEGMRRNSVWTRLPRELAEIVQLTGALKRRIRRLSQNGQE